MPEIVYYDVRFYELVDNFDDVAKSIMKRGQHFADFATAKNMGIFSYSITPPQIPQTIPPTPKPKKSKEEDDE